MPTQIPLFDSPQRCLWLSRGQRGLTLQLQDDIWVSDSFHVADTALRSLSVGFADLEVANESGRMRMRWAGDRLVMEYESTERVRVEEVDVAALLAAIDSELGIQGG